MKKENNKVLLVTITNPAFAIRQINWANAIEGTAWRPIVHCFCSMDSVLEIIDSKSIKRPETLTECTVNKSLPYRFINNISRILNHIPFVGYIRFFSLMAEDIILTKGRISEIRCKMCDNSVSVLLMPDSSPAYFAPLLAYAAKQENVKVITNPLDRDSPQSYAMIYKSDLSLSVERLVCKSVSQLFPKWMIEYDSKSFLRINPHEILSQELLGIAPPKPWTTFGFLEDIVAVSNEIQREFYENLGVDPAKIRVIGCPELDFLANLNVSYETHYKSIINDLEFKEDKPIILCALPQTHWISGRPEAEFQSHEEMIAVFINVLSSQLKYNVIISLHPSMQYEDYKHFDTSFLKVAKVDIMKLLPVCSLYIASLSSTIQFAIALGKPVLNYDVYRYSSEIEYFKFTNKRGVVTILSKSEFESQMIRITSDKGYYEQLATFQMEDSLLWGRLDTRSSSNFVQLLDSLN